MEIKLLNVVMLAEKYQELVDWYQDALGFEIVLKEKGEYHYTELGFNKKSIIGLTPAKEVEHSPTKTRNNSAVLQIQVSDIHSLFKNVKEKSGKILFGPSGDEKYGFLYGAFSDIEGNQIWVIEDAKK